MTVKTEAKADAVKMKQSANKHHQLHIRQCVPMDARKSVRVQPTPGVCRGLPPLRIRVNMAVAEDNTGRDPAALGLTMPPSSLITTLER